MKLAAPILWPSRATPPAKLGLQLVASNAHGEFGAWFHGSLVVPEEGAGTCAQRLSEVFLLAVGERYESPLLGKLIRQRGFLKAPAWEPLQLEKRPHLRAAFSIHSAALGGELVPEDRCFVHAVAGELFSPMLSVPWGKTVAPEKGKEADKTGDQLLAAYDAAFRGEFTSALTSFTAAFTARAALDELDAAHRYNAACCAARAAAQARDKNPAAASAEAKRADKLQQQALAWLAEDLRQRAEAHQRLSFDWAASRGPEARQAEIDELYRGHVQTLAADPDLTGLPLRDLLAIAK